MGEPARLFQRRVPLPQCLIEISEVGEQPAINVPDQDDSLIVGHQLRIGSAIGRIVKSQGLLQVCPTRGECPEEQAGEPAGVAAEHLRRDIGIGFAQVPKLCGTPLRPLQIALSPIVQALAPEDGQQRARPVQRQGQLARPRVDFGKTPVRPAFGS